MPDWMDKVKDKAQQTLQDPQKMDALKSKAADAVGRRLAGSSAQGNYNGPGIDAGVRVVEDSEVAGYGDDGAGEDATRGDAAGSDGTPSIAQGGWANSATPDSGSWDSGGTSDAGGWADGGSSGGSEDNDW